MIWADRNPYIIFVAILENRCPHKFILSLTDLYNSHFSHKSGFRHKLLIPSQYGRSLITSLHIMYVLGTRNCQY